MTFDEAMTILADAEGRFKVVPNDEGDGIRVHYTGTDADEEGRIAQALIVFATLSAEAVGGTLEVRSLQTDNVHTPGVRQGDGSDG